MTLTVCIRVIANSEEKFITFSKYISKTFAIRFVDTCRFMPSQLSSLAKNLLTPDFSKFRETLKYFDVGDMPFHFCHPQGCISIRVYGWLG